MEGEKLIKISFLIPSSEIGGTERMLLLMIENLPRDIFLPPVVFAMKGAGQFTDELKRRGIRTKIFNLKRRPFDFIKLLYSINKESPGILHSFLFYGNLAGRIAGKILRVPIVISSQRSTDLWRKRWHWLLDRFTAEWTDIIISNSYRGNDVLVEKAGISPKKIRVIPNGIRAPKSDKTISKPLGISGAEYIVGTVGNLRKAKGHRYIIMAAPLILKECPNTKFIIVGDGELKDSLIKEAKKTGVSENFIFTGFMDNPADIIPLFDVFVFPSLWEGCPVGLLEAMMLGKSSVAFPVGDIPYIIEEGKSGLLVEYKSVEKLASAVVALLKNRELRDEIGKAAYKRALERFSHKVMMEQYLSAYLELIDFKSKKV